MLNDMTMQDLRAKLDSIEEGELILDVRTPEEYAEGHVPGSKNIPHDEVDKYIEELKKYKTVYIHCRMGGRAQIATQVLFSLGLRNLICIGSNGMAAWLAAGFPVERR